MTSDAADVSNRESEHVDSEQVGLETLSFEQARDELVRVVAQLEQGAPTLEQSLALWTRGEALAARCEDWLLGAKRRLEEARPSDGAPAAEGPRG